MLYMLYAKCDNQIKTLFAFDEKIVHTTYSSCMSKDCTISNRKRSLRLNHNKNANK